jgi:septum formation protein
VIVLASGSATRRRLLEQAGVPHQCVAPDLDERAIKDRLRGDGADSPRIAQALAERKALAVAQRRPRGDLVIGADQVLDCEGTPFDKPRDRADALRQLKSLRGRTHELITACAVADGATIDWISTERARLHMRQASDGFLDRYLDALGDRALAGPGAYQLEGHGAQLFERVDGDFFAVLGLPLLPLLGYLRARGALPA